MHTFTQSLWSTYLWLVDEVDRLMMGFTHTKKDIWYGYRWTFENGMRFDLIGYKKQDVYILRVGRGAWLVQQHPILHGYFDVVSKVIAKLEISDISVLEQKNITWLFRLLDEAPRWVWVRHAWY